MGTEKPAADHGVMAGRDRPVADEDERCLGVGWQRNRLRAVDRRQDEPVHRGEGDVQAILRGASRSRRRVGEHGPCERLHTTVASGTDRCSWSRWLQSRRLRSSRRSPVVPAVRWCPAVPVLPAVPVAPAVSGGAGGPCGATQPADSRRPSTRRWRIDVVAEQPLAKLGQVLRAHGRYGPSRRRCHLQCCNRRRRQCPTSGRSHPGCRSLRKTGPEPLSSKSGSATTIFFCQNASVVFMGATFRDWS
jgi:hypothetical protein